MPFLYILFLQIQFNQILAWFFLWKDNELNVRSLWLRFSIFFLLSLPVPNTYMTFPDSGGKEKHHHCVLVLIKLERKTFQMFV